MKYYTGIGARKTPNDILSLMTKIAIKLNKVGYILRSGGAIGADTAFEKGAGEYKEIYFASDATYDAMLIAKSLHPNWNVCSNYVKKLHARSVFQVLGRDLNSPSSFLICWTIDGCQTHKDRIKLTGGTGTAISVADKYGIPIFNIKNKPIEKRLLDFVNDVI